MISIYTSKVYIPTSYQPFNDTHLQGICLDNLTFFLQYKNCIPINICLLQRKFTSLKHSIKGRGYIKCSLFL